MLKWQIEIFNYLERSSNRDTIICDVFYAIGLKSSVKFKSE